MGLTLTTVLWVKITRKDQVLSHQLNLENFNVWTLLSLGTTTTTRITLTKEINYLNTNHMEITYQEINKDYLTQKLRQSLPQMKTTSPKTKMTLPKNKK